MAFEDLLSSPLNVFIFFSPDCPICQKNSLAIRELQAKYVQDSVQFMLVYPATFSSRKKIRRFQQKYKLEISGILDKQNELVKRLSATVTPECFLVNRKGEVFYSGKIDNAFEDIGKRRTVITARYLDDAIDNMLHNQVVSIKRTEPVGCFITILK